MCEDVWVSESCLTQRSQQDIAKRHINVFLPPFHLIALHRRATKLVSEGFACVHPTLSGLVSVFSLSAFLSLSMCWVCFCIPVVQHSIKAFQNGLGSEIQLIQQYPVSWLKKVVSSFDRSKGQIKCFSSNASFKRNIFSGLNTVLVCWTHAETQMFWSNHWHFKRCGCARVDVRACTFFERVQEDPVAPREIAPLPPVHGKVEAQQIHHIRLLAEIDAYDGVATGCS